MHSCIHCNGSRCCVDLAAALDMPATGATLGVLVQVDVPLHVIQQCTVAWLFLPECIQSVSKCSFS